MLSTRWDAGHPSDTATLPTPAAVQHLYHATLFKLSGWLAARLNSL